MDKSAISLERMRIFVRIAERGSLTAVARELGVGQSTVTRQLRELEESIGVPLLSRTTRRVTMTEEGSNYYTHCVQILRLVEQAAEEARSTRGAATGTVRISCTAAFGVLHVTRIIFAFQDRYPDIRVGLSLTDERIDLVREGVDVAVRLGPLTDSSMKLRPLGQSRRMLVAAPHTQKSSPSQMGRGTAAEGGGGGVRARTFPFTIATQWSPSHASRREDFPSERTARPRRDTNG